MKKDTLKLNSRVFVFLLGLAGMGIVCPKAMAIDPNEGFASLVEKIGPERARAFIKRLENARSDQHVNQPANQSKPAELVSFVTPLALEEVVWLTDQERSEFNTIITSLQAYAIKLYACVESFFNKKNSDPYRTHVHCFQNQLRMIRSALQNYPQSQTEKGAQLFNALKEIALSLEKSQAMMCQTLNQEYKGIPIIKAKVFGDAMNKLTTPVNQLRAHIDKQVGIVRNELRHAHADEMLQRFNKFYQLINRAFDYGNTKSQIEFGMILIHRFKKYV